MRRSEFIKGITKRIYGNLHYQNVRLCEQFYDAFIEEIKDELSETGRTAIKGLFSIEIYDRPAQRRRHPITNEIVTFPPTKAVKCRLSQQIKDLAK